MIYRRSRSSTRTGLAALGLLFASALVSAPAIAQSEPFARPAELESTIEFWKRVFGEWSENQVAFHDRDDPGIVYEVQWQRKSDSRESYRANEAAQKAVIERYRRILLDLAVRNPDPRTLSGDVQRVYTLFGPSASPERFRQAADRIRVQRGIKERFLKGLIHAGQYRDHILHVLREEGVPEEIAWLPMVESTFNLAARSKVGAGGVWQFMPATARTYMKVARDVDERFDPIYAARGAARLLKRNYQGLGSWPLALTAYNHGYYGMRNAVRQLGTNDYVTIRNRYEGRAFGFASKNFYPEFLAALDIVRDPVRYFGPVRTLPPLEFDTIVTPAAMGLSDAGRAIQIEPDLLAELNPALTDDVRRGRRNIPEGFALRVPAGYGEEAPLQLASAVAGRSERRVQSDAPRYYTVERGDTLLSIATRHGVPVGEIVSLNGIEDRNTIRVGQRLQLRP